MSDVRCCQVKQGVDYKPAIIPLTALFLAGAAAVADESWTMMSSYKCHNLKEGSRWRKRRRKRKTTRLQILKRESMNWVRSKDSDKHEGSLGCWSCISSSSSSWCPLNPSQGMCLSWCPFLLVFAQSLPESSVRAGVWHNRLEEVTTVPPHNLLLEMMLTRIYCSCNMNGDTRKVTHEDFTRRKSCSQHDFLDDDN